MKKMEVMGIREMDASEMRNENGGFLLGTSGFNWGAFWKGCGIGLGIGAMAGTAAYIAYA
jgi:hypothetical protein